MLWKRMIAEPSTTSVIALLLALACLPGCERRDENKRAVSLHKFAIELDKAGIWSGGSPLKFVGVGRGTLAASIEYGLMPQDKVLDIGAGSMRVGWWLLHYIDPSNYYAIEPVEKRINTAAEILGADDIHIYYNSDFEFPAVPFDFIIARSIWTHASKTMISKMLSEFAENSSPKAKFLASVALAETESEDYLGEEWKGKVENTGGAAEVVKHSLEWMQEEAKKHGLVLKTGRKLYNQTWVVLKKKSSPEDSGPR